MHDGFQHVEMHVGGGKQTAAGHRSHIILGFKTGIHSGKLRWRLLAPAEAGILQHVTQRPCPSGKGAPNRSPSLSGTHNGRGGVLFTRFRAHPQQEDHRRHAQPCTMWNAMLLELREPSVSSSSQQSPRSTSRPPGMLPSPPGCRSLLIPGAPDVRDADADGEQPCPRQAAA